MERVLPALPWSGVAGRQDEHDEQSPAERLVRRSRIGDEGLGAPLDDRARQRVRSVESVLRGDALPRYIRRAAEIERGVRDAERELGEAYAVLREELGPGREFAARWRAIAAGWDFSALNTLIGQHNAWYPIERDLPIDLRTRDYVLVNGHDYRKRELDLAWVLERFPAE